MASAKKTESSNPAATKDGDGKKVGEPVFDIDTRCVAKACAAARKKIAEAEGIMQIVSAEHWRLTNAAAAAVCKYPTEYKTLMVISHQLLAISSKLGMSKSQLDLTLGAYSQLLT